MQNKKITFDPTINLGHIITMVSVLGVGIAGWYGLQQRVSILEDARLTSKQIYQTRIKMVDDQMIEVKGDIKAIELRINQHLDRHK